MSINNENIPNAMENNNNSNNDEDNNSMNATDCETSGNSSLNISRNNSINNNRRDNNIRRVKYNPDKMWFDYQALFDQSKNWVLHYDLNFRTQEFLKIPVNHTNFETNNLARKALFKDKKNDELINDVCAGFPPAIGEILNNLSEYHDKFRDNISQEDYSTLLYNFKFLLAIRVQFSYGNNNGYYKLYSNIAGLLKKSIPNLLGREFTLLIDDEQLYKIFLPINDDDNTLNNI